MLYLVLVLDLHIPDLHVVGRGPRSSVSDAWSTDVIPSDSESTFASEATGFSLHPHAILDFDRPAIPTLGRIVWTVLSITRRFIEY